MSQVLYVRELVVRVVKRYELVFLFTLKLFAGMFLFGMINGIGLYRVEFAKLFETALDFPFYMLLSLMFALAPPTLACTLVAAAVAVQVSSALIPMVFIALFMVLILVLYCRVSPERCLLILAMLIGFKLNIPYVVVIFAGLYLGLSSIAPVIIAVFINGTLPFFSELVKDGALPEGIELVDMGVGFLDTFKLVFETFTSDFTWVFITFVYAVVILAVYAISRLFTDYCVEIAIATGSFINIIGFICASAFAGIEANVFTVIFMTVLAAALVELFHFFDIVLDYDRTERVQFEDDDNYYYVKIVPKIKALPEEKKAGKSVKSISPGRSPAARDAAAEKPSALQAMHGLKSERKELEPISLEDLSEDEDEDDEDSLPGDSRRP